MSAVARLGHQVRYDLLIFRRNPAAVFFTALIPAVAYVVVGFLLAGDPESVVGFTAALLALAVVGATFVNLGMTMTIRRERGLLKRLRTAPVSPWTFVFSQASVGLSVALGMMVLLTVIGTVLFGLSVSPVGLLLVLLTVLLGVFCFAAMGLALSTFVPSEEAAPSMVQGVALPLYFISGVLVPVDLLPGWVRSIAEIFPVYHFVEAVGASYRWPDSGVPVGHWLVVATWGLAAAAFVVKRFRWVPNR